MIHRTQDESNGDTTSIADRGTAGGALHERSLREIIAAGLATKEAAIRGCDRWIWTVRLGFVLVVFAGFALLLLLLPELETFVAFEALLATFGFPAAGLGAVAFVFEHTLILRKRDIAKSRSDLVALAVRHGERLPFDDWLRAERLEPLLASEAGHYTTAPTSSFTRADWRLAALIYGIPLLALAIACLLLLIPPNQIS